MRGGYLLDLRQKWRAEGWSDFAVELPDWLNPEVSIDYDGVALQKVIPFGKPDLSQDIYAVFKISGALDLPLRSDEVRYLKRLLHDNQDRVVPERKALFSSLYNAVSEATRELEFYEHTCDELKIRPRLVYARPTAGQAVPA